MRKTAVDIAAYRAASEDIAAGIAVVATATGRTRHAVTVDSYLDVSYAPPTMLVSLYEGARIADAIDETERWTLSVLREDQEGIARWLGTPGQPIHGLLDRVPLETTPGGLPRIAGALAWFELDTIETFEAATHRLVVGEVRDFGREPHTDGVPTRPLVRFGGRYLRA